MHPEDEQTELAIPTADGEFIATYSEKGLISLNFPSKNDSKHGETADLFATQVQRWHLVTSDALKRALAGQIPQILPPLDWSGSTDFQQRVWKALLQIPCGETRSYGEIARAIRNPRAVRAVGGACSANPIPILVPCHRVLAANHKIGGFSGGLKWKRTLLAREQDLGDSMLKL